MTPRARVAGADPTTPTDDEVEVVLRACRVLVAVTARSLAEASEVTDLLHIRALFVVSDQASTSLTELAEAVGIHLTRASRLCDRLVKAGLLHRADDPANRRQVVLRLTPAGREVVATVRRRRADAIAPILAGMSPESRDTLVQALEDFARAAGVVADSDLWALGWER